MSDPRDVTLDHLSAVLGVPGLKPASRRVMRMAVGSFFSWAVLTRRLTADPCVGLPVPRVPRGVPRPTPRPLITAALDSASDRDALLILLARGAGLRRTELSRVHTDDIVDGDEGPELVVVGKGGGTRLVPLHPDLTCRLLAIRAARPGWVFPGRTDGHLSPDRVQRILSGLLGPGWSGHSLRHRFAADCYEATRDILAVRDLLGHRSILTTIIYTPIPPGARREAVLGIRL